MKNTFRFFGVLFLSLLVITHLQATKAKAVTFSVTNLNDSGAGSLRQAILDVNVQADADTIEFQITGTINLLSALPDLSSDITINGISADSSIVRRGSTILFRIFTVTTGANITLNNLTMQNGQAPAIRSDKYTKSVGGAILNGGNLNIRNSKILDNSASGSVAAGGGVYNEFGNISIEKTVFLNNRTSDNGGCPVCSSNGGSIYNLGTIKMVESEVSNSAGGAAFYNDFSGQAIILESKIANSQKRGIYNDGNLVLKKSSVVNNSDSPFSGFGTGAFLFRGNVTIEDSTFSGNVSQQGIGAIYFYTGTLKMSNSTITNNQGNVSGGVYLNNCDSPCKIEITNPIFAGKISATNSMPDFYGRRINDSGSYYSGSYNLIGNGTGSNFVNGVNGNIVGTETALVNPQLSPLGNYGGKTPTHKLLASSPAINAANLADFSPTDQRGVPRPVGSLADIGAVEFNLLPSRYLPNGGLNANYDQLLKAFADNPNAAFSFAVSAGSLPPGLSLNQESDTTAIISGVPLQTGTYNFSITATNADNFTVSADYNLTIRSEVFFVTVSGRVSSAEGRGISKAFVQLIDRNGNIINQTLTNPFGFYRFNNTQAQENYTFRVISKNRQFTTQNVTISNKTADLNFTAQPLPENFQK